MKNKLIDTEFKTAIINKTHFFNHQLASDECWELRLTGGESAWELGLTRDETAWELELTRCESAWELGIRRDESA